MLTDSEHEAVDLAGRLYTLIANEIVAHGDCREDDLREVMHHIHVIQRYVMSQAAARTSEPGQYRLLGLGLEESANEVRNPQKDSR